MSASTRAQVSEQRHLLVNRSTRPGWMWVLYLVPALLAAAYIVVYGVNVPITDEWGLPWMFSMLKEGGHGFGVHSAFADAASDGTESVACLIAR